MSKRHHELKAARASFRTLPDRLKADTALRRSLTRQWREATLKDETGRQCVLLVADIIERNQPLKW